jgi:hypothetical protein
MKKIITLIVFLVDFSLMAQTPKLVKKWETEAVLKVPESIIYDENTSLIYVANINGSPLDKDGNGSIGKLGIDGKIIDNEWITGLDAPKGMGIFKDKLYATDINKVVVIDIKSSRIIQKIEIPGTQFLNDISIDKNGVVYITDSNTLKVYKIKDGVASVWLESPLFTKPNGLLAQEKSIKLIDMGTGKFYNINYDDKKITELATGLAGGDGIVQIGADEYLISNWSGEVNHVKNQQVTTVLDTKDKKMNAADIWYIPSQNLLLVPTFFGNTIAAYSIEK